MLRGFHDYLLCLSYSLPIRHVANCQVDLVPHLITRRSFWLAVFLGRKDCGGTPIIAGEINSTGETFPSRCGADQLNSHIVSFFRHFFLLGLSREKPLTNQMKDQLQTAELQRLIRSWSDARRRLTLTPQPHQLLTQQGSEVMFSAWSTKARSE